MATKIDLTDEKPENRDVSREVGEFYAQDNGYEYFEVSSKDGRGINDLMERAVELGIGHYKLVKNESKTSFKRIESFVHVDPEEEEVNESRCC